MAAGATRWLRIGVDLDASKLADGAGRGERAIDGLDRSTQKLGRTLGRTETQTLAQREASLQLETAQSRLSRATNRYGSESLQARRAALGVERANLAVAASSQQARGRLSSLGGTLASSAKRWGALGLAVVAAGAIHGTIQAYGNYDTALRDAGAAAQVTGRQLDALGRTAREQGLSTGVGATAATEALGELAKAGLSAADIGPALHGTLLLAQAGSIGSAEAASTAANAMQTFGLRAQDVVTVADTLANAANLTTADVGDFGLALSQAGAGAKLAGVSFADTILALTDLARIGVKGSDAGTSLKAAFGQLAAPTAQASAAMQKYGLTFFDSAGKMKSVDEISGMLHDRLGGLSKQQQVATLRTIAGTDGFRALAAMMRHTQGESDRLGEQLTKVGSAAENARAKNAGYAGAMSRLKAAGQELGIVVGGVLVPYLTTGADYLARLVKEMEHGTGTGGKIRDVLGQIAAGAKDVGGAVAPIAKDIAAFVGHNPDVLKLAGGVLAVSLAVKGMRWASALTGLDTFVRLAGRVGRPLGRTIGSRVASAAGTALSAGASGIASVARTAFRPVGSAAARATAAGYAIVDRVADAVTAAASGARAVARRKFSALGGVAGRAFAAGQELTERVGAAISTAIGGTRGSTAAKFRSFGRGAGKAFGAAFIGGALLGITALASDLQKKVTELLGIDTNSNRYGPANGGGFFNNPLETLGGLIGIGNAGGRLHRDGFRRFARGGLAALAFAGGGMVPALVSPGEMIAYGGQAGIVPGPRVAADNTFMLLPVGAEVYTDHGQALLAAGASREQALANQIPHFAAGGPVVRGRGSWFGGGRDPGNPNRTTASGASDSAPGVAVRPGATYLSGRPYLGGVWDIGAPNRRHANLRQTDLGPHESTGRRIDITPAGFAQLGYTGATFPTDAVFTASYLGRGAASGSSSAGRGGARYRVRYGDPYGANARDAGLEAGKAGATRIGGSLLGEMIAGALATRERIETGTTRGSSSASRTSTSGATSRWAAGPVGSAQGQLSAAQARARAMGLAITSTTGGRHTPGSWHYRGRAFDAAGPARSMAGFARWANATYGRSILELFYDPVGWYRKNGTRRSGSIGGHSDHVHLALRRGGVARLAQGGVLGRRLAAVAGADSVDAAGTTGAYRALARLLASETRVGWSRLATVIDRAESRAAAARKSGDVGLARRQDAVATIASAEQDRRVGVSLTRASSTVASADRTASIAGSLQSIAGIDPSSVAGLQGTITSTTGQIAQLRGGRAELEKRLAQARKAKDKSAVAEITEGLQSIDDAILSRTQTIRDAQRALPKQQAAERLAGYDRNLGYVSAYEQATAGKVGTSAVAGTKLGILQGQESATLDEIAKATRENRPDDAVELIGKLVAIRDGIKETTAAVRYGDGDARLSHDDAELIKKQVDTPDDKSDDRVVLARQLGEAKRLYGEAVAADDDDGIKKYGPLILGLTESIKQLDDSMSQLTDLQQTLIDLTRESVANQARLATLVSIQGPQLLASVTEAVSGGIGGQLTGASQMTGFPGKGARF